MQNVVVLVLQQILLYKIIGGMLLMCQKTECGYMEHGLKHITFYVQKHVAALAMCYNPVLVWGKPLGVLES